MAKRELPIEYDGKCPCRENGADGTPKHTEFAGWSIQKWYKFAICKNHLPNYAGIGVFNISLDEGTFAAAEQP